MKHIRNFLSIASPDLFQSICDAHPNAEITFATHFDPESTERNPMIAKGGKHMIVFPPFPRIFGYGCFHPKLILIRFPDRLRVRIDNDCLSILTIRLSFLRPTCWNATGRSIHSVFGLKTSLIPPNPLGQVWLRRRWIWNFVLDSLPSYASASVRTTGFSACCKTYSLRTCVYSWSPPFPVYLPAKISTNLVICDCEVFSAPCRSLNPSTTCRLPTRFRPFFPFAAP